MKANEVNSLILAYLGDAVYELYIREYFIKKGIAKVNDLQKEVTSYVSAKGQFFYLSKLMEEDFFTEEEIQVIKRARNNKSSNHPKNTDVVTYKYATGLEALIGYLYLNNNTNRIEKIMENILGE